MIIDEEATHVTTTRVMVTSIQSNELPCGLNIILFIQRNDNRMKYYIIFSFGDVFTGIWNASYIILCLLSLWVL